MNKKKLVLIILGVLLTTNFTSSLNTSAISEESYSFKDNKTLTNVNSDFSLNDKVKLASIEFPKIDRYPLPIDYSWNQENLGDEFPSYDPNSGEFFQVNVMSCNLTEFNLIEREEDLMYASFDSKTIWPEELPENFDPDVIMEMGKNPGLNVTTLHNYGITGRNVGIAVIDQALLVNHTEYYDRIQLYEEINWPASIPSLHGPAVTSIAAGLNTGVAPGADLYNIGQFNVDNEGETNYTFIAQSIERILEINEMLPEDRKIRVISISAGWMPDDIGYEEVETAVNNAKNQGLFVISSCMLRHYGLNFNGMGRDPLKDPDKFSSYEPGLFWKDNVENYKDLEALFLPMDSRTTASPIGIDDYAFYRMAGLSWAIPYLSGLYALACQINPDITPELFLNQALETGEPMKVEIDEEICNIGKIVNPIKLIYKLTFPKKIDRYPTPADYSFFQNRLNGIFPSYDPNSGDSFQVDVRSCNLTEFDLIDREEDLMYATFDSKTIWPEELPENFDPEVIMEMGKNPGLNVTTLHNRGITGNNVGIAVIDQSLLVGHTEYFNRVQLYEEVNWPWSDASMHGSAVTSIAAGLSTGVAPGADLYNIAVNFADIIDNEIVLNFTYIAQSIERILEINEMLSEDNKIRVISISRGWSPGAIGYEDVESAVNKAINQGIFVISSNLDEHYGFLFHGMGRDPLKDPDKFSSYEPGLSWKNFIENIKDPDLLLLPMDSITTASPTGIDDYVFYRVGGWSWIIPYLAGLYALACQVKPDITPEFFLNHALETGEPMNVEINNEICIFGNIVNPVKLIEVLTSDDDTIPPDDDDDDEDNINIPGYDTLLIIGAIGLVAVVLIKKRLKNNKN